MLVVPFGHGRHGVGEQHESLLHAVARHLAEQPSHSPDPAAGLRDVAPLHQVEDQPECRARRTRGSVAADEALVSAGHQGGALGVAAEHAAGDREPLQVLGLERGLPVGGR